MDLRQEMALKLITEAQNLYTEQKTSLEAQNLANLVGSVQGNASILSNLVRMTEPAKVQVELIKNMISDLMEVGARALETAKAQEENKAEIREEQDEKEGE